METMTNDRKRTEDYADGIAATLAALEELAGIDLTDPDEVFCLTPEGSALLRELADLGPEEPTYEADEDGEFVGVADEVTDLAEDGGPVARYVDNALDVEVYGRLTSDGWDVTDVALLVTVGGPNARAWVATDHLRVEVAWGGDVARRTVYAPTVADYLYDLADGQAEAFAAR